MPDTDVSGRAVALRDVDLDRFFNPETVAVIGASDTPGRPTTLNFRRIREWSDHAGARMYPVNPNKQTVDGLRCYPSVLDVPEDVDLAVLLVSDALSALEDAIEKKARFVVMFAAGFAEVGDEGAGRQARLVEALAGSDVHLLGPNTNLNAFEIFREDLPGPSIALITQSGHQGRPIFQGQEIGISMSHWAPTGNEADLESADFIRYFADQAGVGVIAAYIEGFKDGRSLMLALDHAARRGVPVVMVKVGRTDVGRSWAMSHTGHLAGSDAITSAVFRQFGVTRVDGLDELLDVSMMLARSKAPRGKGVCIYSISGGTSAHMADMATAAGLALPELSDGTQAQLREWIPGYLRISNPVDNGGHPTGDWRGRRILDALVADPNVDVLVVPITGAFSPISDKFAEDLVAVAETTDKPVCVIWGSPAADEAAYRQTLLRSRLPVFRTFGNCVTAVKTYLDYHSFRRHYRTAFYRPVTKRIPTSHGVGEQLARLPAGAALSEHRAKELLGDYGIAVTAEVLCTSAKEAAKVAGRIGFPVVMKPSSPALAHKSDLGLVRLGVASAKEASSAFSLLSEAAERHAPGRVEGVLVCETVTGVAEAILGISQDQLFGPTVMLGLGGVSVEVFGDVTFRVPPFGSDEARRMVEELRSLPLLRGARGRPSADLAALVRVIMKVQRMALDLAGEVRELDINPLALMPARGRPPDTPGAVALDALVVAR